MKYLLILISLLSCGESNKKNNSSQNSYSIKIEYVGAIDKPIFPIIITTNNTEWKQEYYNIHTYEKNKIIHIAKKYFNMALKENEVAYIEIDESNKEKILLLFKKMITDFTSEDDKKLIEDLDYYLLRLANI